MKLTDSEAPHARHQACKEPKEDEVNRLSHISSHFISFHIISYHFITFLCVSLKAPGHCSLCAHEPRQACAEEHQDENHQRYDGNDHQADRWRILVDPTNRLACP